MKEASRAISDLASALINAADRGDTSEALIYVDAITATAQALSGELRGMISLGPDLGNLDKYVTTISTPPKIGGAE